jgi:hypothetical protein
MKVGILVALIVLPMLTSIGLYCYAFVSTRWSYLDESLIAHHNRSRSPERGQSDINPKNVQLRLQTMRHAFRSHYGLFGYCLDYRWLSLLAPKPIVTAEQPFRSNSTLACRRCIDPKNRCPDNNCCVKFFIEIMNNLFVSLLFRWSDVIAYLTARHTTMRRIVIDRIIKPDTIGRRRTVCGSPLGLAINLCHNTCPPTRPRLGIIIII